MYCALYTVLLAVSVSADVIVDGEVAACAPVKEQAKQAVLDAIGMGSDAAVTAARDHCKAMDQTGCGAATECKFCSGDSTCWPTVDLDNPCDAGTLNNILLAGEIAGEVGSAIGETTSSVLSKCSDPPKTSEEDCPSLLCEWCADTSSCHVYGSANNQCLVDRLKQMAKEQSEAAMNAAKEAASAEVQAIMDSCGSLSGNETGCGEQSHCYWCGSTHNICYFMGDNSNKCIRERVQKHIDAATGVAKPIAEWAGSTYTDLDSWSSGLCGGHTDESGCSGDVKCSWCAAATSCHVWGSTANKCGNIAKAGQAVTDKFNDIFGSSSNCDADEVLARQTMKDGFDAASANLLIACQQYMESKFYAQQSLASLAEDAGGAATSVTDSLSEMAAVQVDSAKTALKDAMAASNDTMSLEDTLAAFDAANPCAALEASSATMSSVASFILPAQMASIVFSYCF